MKKILVLIMTFILAGTSFAMAQEVSDTAQAQQVQEAKTYAIDAAHSTLGFAVRHMGVGKTRGSFDEYEGTITYDPATMSLSAQVTIKAASIDTDNENRDNHLRSADFFDVETHPAITFNNVRLKQIDDTDMIFGDLTIKGVTKTVTIPVEIAGPVAGNKGASMIGIIGSTTINRQDFNVNWSKTMDSGGMVVDNNVELIIEIEAKAG